jgi:hypothetical protein
VSQAFPANIVSSILQHKNITNERKRPTSTTTKTKDILWSRARATEERVYRGLRRGRRETELVFTVGPAIAGCGHGGGGVNGDGAECAVSVAESGAGTSARKGRALSPKARLVVGIHLDD